MENIDCVAKNETQSAGKYSGTHHANGEVVVDDVVGYGLSGRLIILNLAVRDLDSPPVHHHRGRLLDFLPGGSSVLA